MLNDSKWQSTRFKIFAAVWVCSTTVLGWQLWQGQQSSNFFQQVSAFIALILTTVAFLWWIPSPIPQVTLTAHMHRNLGSWGLIVASVCVLFVLPVVLGMHLLWLFPVVALVALAVLRKPISQREWIYALILALIAGVAALNAGWISRVTPITWAVLQVLLVTTGCAVGWQLLRDTTLMQIGVGQSVVLTHGAFAGLRSFTVGAVVAMPWALGLLVLGGAQSESWVTRWWQPFVAIQPAIAEEAWGRILLVPLFYYLTRRVYHPRKAFTFALVIIVYWFAFLHTIGSPGVVINTLFTGTLFALPVSYLCLYQNYEVAVGFHFWIDFIKFGYAYLLFSQ